MTDYEFPVTGRDYLFAGYSFLRAEIHHMTKRRKNAKADVATFSLIPVFFSHFQALFVFQYVAEYHSSVTNVFMNQIINIYFFYNMFYTKF